MKSLIFISLISVLNLSYASSCDRPKNDFDSLYCLNKVYQEADKELSENFKLLSSKLNYDGKRDLKSSQLEWMQDRNKSCSIKRSSGFYVDLNCATETTIQRSQFLQDRIRECKSTGCQNSKLN